MGWKNINALFTTKYMNVYILWENSSTALNTASRILETILLLLYWKFIAGHVNQKTYMLFKKRDTGRKSGLFLKLMSFVYKIDQCWPPCDFLYQYTTSGLKTQGKFHISLFGVLKTNVKDLTIFKSRTTLLL